MDEHEKLQIEREDITARRRRRRYLAALFAIVVLALVVRSLTGYFIREHFDDPGWFQSGSYKVFDRNAQDILDGNVPVFWIDDPTRTDRMSYPPGFPWWVAAIYIVTGDRTTAA